MLIQCGSCQQQFKGSQSLAGRTVKCPHCGQVIDIPVLARPAESKPAAPSAAPTQPRNLADQGAGQRVSPPAKSPSSPLARPFGAPASTQPVSTTTPSVEELLPLVSLDAAPLSDELPELESAPLLPAKSRRVGAPLSPYGFPRPTSNRSQFGNSWFSKPGTLVVATLLVALGVVVVFAGILNRPVFLVAAVCLSLVALAAWRSETARRHKSGGAWLAFEMWLGRILYGLAALRLLVMYCQAWLISLRPDPHVHLNMLIVSIVFFVELAIIVFTFAAAEEHGFFAVACWLYDAAFIVVAVVLLAAMGLGHDPWTVYDDGQRVLAGSHEANAGPDNTAQLPPTPPTPIKPGNPIIVAPSPPSTAEKAAPILARWTATPDPRREPLERISAAGLAVPLVRFSPVVLPQSTSPFAAVGDNIRTTSFRQLWDLRLGRSVGRIDGKIEFADSVALSPDGQRMAGRIQLTDLIEVWSFQRGALEARIPTGDRGPLGLVAFLDADRLVYSSRGSEGPALKVSNLKEPAAAADVVPVSPRFNDRAENVAISPGGKYLVNANNEQRIQVYDLAAHQLAGEVQLPASARGGTPQIRGLSFSSDGRQLAALVAESSESRILVWNFADGTLTTDYQIASDLGSARASRSGPNIEFLPDRAGWLVYQRTIVPFRAGQQAWVKGVAGEAARASSRLRVARVVDDNTLLVASDELLATFRLPRDGNGRLKLGDGPFALESLWTAPAAGVATGVNPAVPGNPQPAVASVDRDFEKRSVAYLRDQLAELILGDGKALVERMQWLPAQKRPSIGVRWALGVQITGRTDAAAIHSLADLADVTGPIGPGLLDALQQRMADGKFGAWPKADDPRLREVRLLGSGKPADLDDSARRQGLDLLLQVDLDTQLIGFSKRWQTTAKVRIVDPSTGLTLWASEPLTDTQVALALRNGNEDPRVLLVQKVAAKIDLDYQLDKMPELTADQVAHRLAELGRQKLDKPLLVLAELRYYQAQKLAAHDDLDRLYDQILGPGGGRKMLEGTDAERREALEVLLKQ